MEIKLYETTRIDQEEANLDIEERGTQSNDMNDSTDVKKEGGRRIKYGLKRYDFLLSIFPLLVRT